MFAGFGGQGILSMGSLVASAGMVAGRHTTFFPAYGIAQRGGSANCTVIVSDDPVASPVVADPGIMVAMNEQALDAFESWVAPGGWLFVNSTLTDRKVERTDVRPVYVPATQWAVECGDSRMANMAMLGAVIKVTGILPFETVVATMVRTCPSKILHLLESNKNAFGKGYASV